MVVKGNKCAPVVCVTCWRWQWLFDNI